MTPVIPQLVQTMRQGVSTSSSLAHQAPPSTITATGLMSDADAQDTTKTLTLTLMHCFDGSDKNFVPGLRATWQGGPAGPKGIGLPSISESFTAAGLKPTSSRVKVDSPSNLSYGFQLASA